MKDVPSGPKPALSWVGAEHPLYVFSKHTHAYLQVARSSSEPRPHRIMPPRFRLNSKFAGGARHPSALRFQSMSLKLRREFLDLQTNIALTMECSHIETDVAAMRRSTMSYRRLFVELPNNAVCLGHSCISRPSPWRRSACQGWYG